MSDEKTWIEALVEDIDHEALANDEIQICLPVNSLSMNKAALEMVHKNNPKATRFNAKGYLCVSRKAYDLLVMGLGGICTAQPKKPKVDGDYV